MFVCRCSMCKGRLKLKPWVRFLVEQKRFCEILLKPFYLLLLDSSLLVNIAHVCGPRGGLMAGSWRAWAFHVEPFWSMRKSTTTTTPPPPPRVLVFLALYCSEYKREVSLSTYCWDLAYKQSCRVFSFNWFMTVYYLHLVSTSYHLYCTM